LGVPTVAPLKDGFIRLIGLAASIAVAAILQAECWTDTASTARLVAFRTSLIPFKGKRILDLRKCPTRRICFFSELCCFCGKHFTATSELACMFQTLRWVNDQYKTIKLMRFVQQKLGLTLYRYPSPPHRRIGYSAKRVNGYGR
jgi:hypothetical protein